MRFTIVLIGSFLLAGATSARRGTPMTQSSSAADPLTSAPAQSPTAPVQAPQHVTPPASSRPPSPPSAQASSTPARTFQCPHPADPRRRQHGCNEQDFDWDETLAGGWDKVRRAARKIGITPTASYTGALQTNVTGGNHQVWSYAGLLSLAVNADFEKLTKIPGLSAYVGASWGTGSYLAGSVNSAIPTSILYAPSFYLGEMYLQERLAKTRLTLLGGTDFGEQRIRFVAGVHELCDVRDQQ